MRANLIEKCTQARTAMPTHTGKATRSDDGDWRCRRAAITRLTNDVFVQLWDEIRDRFFPATLSATL
jgi:hypothetical protein